MEHIVESTLLTELKFDTKLVGHRGGHKIGYFSDPKVRFELFKVAFNLINQSHRIANERYPFKFLN